MLLRCYKETSHTCFYANVFHKVVHAYAYSPLCSQFYLLIKPNYSTNDHRLLGFMCSATAHYCLCLLSDCSFGLGQRSLVDHGYDSLELFPRSLFSRSTTFLRSVMMLSAAEDEKLFFSATSTMIGTANKNFKRISNMKDGKSWTEDKQTRGVFIRRRRRDLLWLL